jgi:hypothetical protein
MNINGDPGQNSSDELFVPSDFTKEQKIAPASNIEKLNEQAQALHNVAMNFDGQTVGGVRIEADPNRDMTSFHVDHIRDSAARGVPGYPVKKVPSAFWDRYTLYRRDGEGYLTLGHESCRKAADEARLGEVTVTTTITPLKFGAKRKQRREDGRLDDKGEILPDTRTTHEPHTTDISPAEAADVKKSLDWLSETIHMDGFTGPRRSMSAILAKLIGRNTIHE